MKRETVGWLIVLLGLLGGMFCFYWHQPNAPLRDYFMAQRIAGFNDFLNLLRQMDQGAFARDVVAYLERLPIQPKHLFVARSLPRQGYEDLPPMLHFRENLVDGSGVRYDQSLFLQKLEDPEVSVCLAYYPPAIAKVPTVIYLLFHAGRLVDVEGGTVLDRDNIISSREVEVLSVQVFEAWDDLLKRYPQFKRIRVGFTQEKKAINLQVYYQGEDGRTIQWRGSAFTPEAPYDGSFIDWIGE